MTLIRRFWPACLLAALAASLFLVPAFNRELFIAGHQAARAWAAPLWRVASVFGDWPTVIALLLPLAWFHPQRAVAIAASTLGAVAAAIVLKAGFAEPRPPLVLPPGTVLLLDTLPGNGSFPSGHAMASAFLATWLWSLRPGAWRWLLLPAVALVCASRIAIGVHWPIDVSVGVLVGWLAAYLGARWQAPWSLHPGRGLVGWALMAALAASLAYHFAKGWALPLRHEEFWLRMALMALVLGWGVRRLTGRAPHYHSLRS